MRYTGKGWLKLLQNSTEKDEQRLKNVVTNAAVDTDNSEADGRELYDEFVKLLEKQITRITITGEFKESTDVTKIKEKSRKINVADVYESDDEDHEPGVTGKRKQKQVRFENYIQQEELIARMMRTKNYVYIQNTPQILMILFPYIENSGSIRHI